MYVRVWLHETSFRERRCAKTSTAMAVPAIVAATALDSTLVQPLVVLKWKQILAPVDVCVTVPAQVGLGEKHQTNVSSLYLSQGSFFVFRC